MKQNRYTIPLALVFCLFFLWAISSNLLPTMIRQLMKTCELNTFEASFTETVSRRLNLTQSFNGLGAFISAIFLSKLISGCICWPFCQVDGLVRD